MSLENKPAAPLGIINPDMPEQEKHRYFSAFFEKDPWGLSVIKAFNSLNVPSGVGDITRRAVELGGETPAEITAEQVTTAIKFLSDGLGLVEMQEGDLFQLTTAGRVYVDRQLTLIDDATQDLK